MLFKTRVLLPPHLCIPMPWLVAKRHWPLLGPTQPVTLCFYKLGRARIPHTCGGHCLSKDQSTSSSYTNWNVSSIMGQAGAKVTSTGPASITASKSEQMWTSTDLLARAHGSSTWKLLGSIQLHHAPSQIQAAVSFGSSLILVAGSLQDAIIRVFFLGEQQLSE